jgi:hypothetical protein
MTDQSAENGATCTDGLPFDPEPWSSYSMAASAQRRWSQTRFAPRKAYCQDEGHYPDTIYTPSNPPGGAG